MNHPTTLALHPGMTASQTRIAPAVAGALAMTALLFTIMHLAVENDEITIDPARPSLPVDYYRIPESQVVPPPPEIQKPPEVAKEPPRVAPPIDEVGDGVGIGVDIAAPAGTPGSIDPGGYLSDGVALPIVRVAPEYPRRAASRGIEGWVIVEFMIDRLGRVQNARVIDAQPKSIFDDAALKAVLKYKYRPQVQNGTPVEVVGERQRIVFELS